MTVENMWPSEIERYWVGSQFLSIPEMDWKLDSGRLVCIKSGTNKGVVMLTKSIVNPMDGFELTFEGGLLSIGQQKKSKMGVVLGLSEPDNNRVDFSKGLFAGISSDGFFFLDGKSTMPDTTYTPGEKIIFYIEGIPLENGTLQLMFRVRGEGHDNQLGELFVEVVPEKVKGTVSLYVNSVGKSDEPVAWFESLEFIGKGVQTFPGKSRGPIVNIDKQFQGDSAFLIVKLAPVLLNNNEVVLQSKGSGEWSTIAKAQIDNSYQVRLVLPEVKTNFHYRIYTHYIDRYGSQKYQYVKLNLAS